jgi:molecular chaperone DnaK (HSP70)
MSASMFNRQMEYLDEYFSQLRSVIQRVKGAASHQKNAEAGKAEEIKKNIENVLQKKIKRALDKADDDEKEEFENKIQNAEENYQLLLTQLEDAKNDCKKKKEFKKKLEEMMNLLLIFLHQ